MSKIKEATDDSIYFAFDTHSEEASQAITSKVISSKGLGGKLITLLPVPEAVAKLRPEVTMQSESVLFYLSLVADFARYMALLRVRVEWSLFGVTYPASPSDKHQISTFLRERLPTLIAEGKLQLPKLKLYKNGLDDINEGIEYMVAGKVSAEKLVFSLPN